MRTRITFRFGSCLLSLGLAAGAPAAFSSSAGAQSLDNMTSIGVPMQVETLANVAVGGPYDKTASYRFKAQKSGRLRGFKVWWKFGSTNPSSLSRESYSAGDGGRIRVTLRESDPAAGYTPKSTVLGSVDVVPNLVPGSTSVYQNRLSNFRFKTQLLSGSPAITAGKHYHLVFDNVDGGYKTNYLSLNTLLGVNPRSSVLPTIPLADLATMVKTGTGSWQVRSTNVPVFQLEIDGNGDGTVDSYQGQGYIDSMAEHDSYNLSIQGSTKVRQTIVPQRDTVVKYLMVNVGKYHQGSGALKVQLQNGSGGVMYSHDRAASSIRYALGGSTAGCPSPIDGSVKGTYCHQWVKVWLPAPTTLKAWQAYRIVLSAPSGAPYKVNWVQDGNVNYPFSDDVVVPAGAAEYTTGSTWGSVLSYGSRKSNQDLQVFLGL